MYRMYKKVRIDRGHVEPRYGYILPVREKDIRILQGYDGPFSHFLVQVCDGDPYKYIDDRYSIDIAVPVGTPVIAARPGIIKIAFDGSDRYYDGTDIQTAMKFFFHTNLVEILHDDGTYALYTHLAKGCLSVTMGAHVDQGQIIAFTGRSGWIGPNEHLHFEVYERYVPPFFRASLPVNSLIMTIHLKIELSERF